MLLTMNAMRITHKQSFRPLPTLSPAIPCIRSQYAHTSNFHLIFFVSPNCALGIYSHNPRNNQIPLPPILLWELCAQRLLLLHRPKIHLHKRRHHKRQHRHTTPRNKQHPHPRNHLKQIIRARNQSKAVTLGDSSLRSTWTAQF